MNRLIASLLLIFAMQAPRAEAQDDAFIPPWPKDFNQVDFYLLTIGRGPQAYALFGHSILRVVDRDRKLDMNFNWGIFDFNAPNFAWKFYQGDLDYQLAISDFVSNVKHYRNVERRSMLQEKFELTNKQKEKLYERLVWNAQPENMFYSYSQFRDNCATKLRDRLDEALGGKIQEFYSERRATPRFRWHIRNNAEPVWWVYLGLDTVSNDWLDKPITNWDEMFLPSQLQTHLRRMPAYDDDGNPIAGKNLLSGAEMIIDLPEPAPATSPYTWIALLLGLPIVVSAAALIVTSLPSWRPRTGSGGWRGPAVVLFGIISVIYGLWSGALGILLTANWLLSNYGELKHNANLWVFWPTDWLFVVYGIYLIKHKAPPVMPVKAAWLRSIDWLARLHLVGLAVCIFLSTTGFIRQEVLPMLASAGLAGVIYYATVARFGALRGI